jgi:hypothetical protein
MLGPTTTHLVSKLYCPYWCTGLELYVIKNSLHVELVLLRGVFRQNGYDWQIHRVLNHCPNISQPDNNPDSVAFIPHVGPIFNRISRVLSQHNIKSVGLPPKRVSSFLQPVKDILELRIPGIYRIAWEWGKVYIGQTGCYMDTRLKECQQHIQTSQPWLNTESTWDTAFNFTIPPSSPLKPDTWIASLWRSLRLSFSPTI